MKFKLATVVLGIGLGIFALSGCKGATDEDKSVSLNNSKWRKACAPGSTIELYYRKQNYDYNDTHLKVVNTYYGDDDTTCSGDVTRTVTYTVPYALGAKTTTSSGEDALEYKEVGMHGDYYSMIYFDDKNKMKIAEGESCGKTKETRCDMIDENGEWFVRQ